MGFIIRLLGQFRSLRRFPVPVAIAILLTILVNLEIMLLSQPEPLFAKLGELNISVDILDSPHRVDYPR